MRCWTRTSRTTKLTSPKPNRSVALKRSRTGCLETMISERVQFSKAMGVYGAGFSHVHRLLGPRQHRKRLAVGDHSRIQAAVGSVKCYSLGDGHAGTGHKIR